MKVILISGKAMAGKDTTANEIKRQLELKGKNVLISHYADLLKYICKTFFNWDGEKDENGRDLLQYVGTDVIREENPDYWVDFIYTFLGMFENEWDYVLIPDTRFPNEVDYFKDYGDWYDFNVYTLRVIRQNFESNLTDEQKNHLSETALDNYVFDTILNNDGTEYGLCLKVQGYIEHVLREE